MSTDYEEQESIEYEEMITEIRLADIRRNKRRRRLVLIGRLIEAVLRTIVILILAAAGWQLILFALGVPVEGWSIRDWAYLAIGTHTIATSIVWVHRRGT